MPHRDIKLRKFNIGPHKAFMHPDFDAPTVLVSDQFDFVELWLKRHSTKQAQLFWQQAENFFRASLTMPNESRAVASYYCMLNAAKALLESKGLAFSSLHGMSGDSVGQKTSLLNEQSVVKATGIFMSLSTYYGASPAGQTVTLKDVLYNIPFIHRAFTVTFRGSQNLFIPIKNGHFVRQARGPEAWFQAAVTDKKHCRAKTMARQRGWEVDARERDTFVIRRKLRFRWDTSHGTKKADRIRKLVAYHRKIRRDIKYIYGEQRLWYYKRNDRTEGILHWPTPSLVFIAMHRLSELTRYDPKKLHAHFDCQHNWLLTEFLNQATQNFVDQIASDVTGQELMVPGYR